MDLDATKKGYTKGLATDNSIFLPAMSYHYGSDLGSAVTSRKAPVNYGNDIQTGFAITFGKNIPSGAMAISSAQSEKRLPKQHTNTLRAKGNPQIISTLAVGNGWPIHPKSLKTSGFSQPNNKTYHI